MDEKEFEEFCLGAMLPITQLEEEEVEKEQIPEMSEKQKLIEESFNALDFSSDDLGTKMIEESVEDIDEGKIYFEEVDDLELFEEGNKGIDEDILPIVQTLNSKGYKVKYSCSGHPSARAKNDKFRDGIYKGKLYSTARIIFDKKYNIGHAPKYWMTKSLKDGSASAIYIEPPTFKIVDGMPTEAFNKWKAKYMNSLKTWVNGLPHQGTEKKEDVKKVEESVLDTLFLDIL